MANTYENWRSSKENVILSRKCDMKEIRSDSLGERTMRANLALCRLEEAISLLKSRKISHEEKLKTIDAAMFTEIAEWR